MNVNSSIRVLISGDTRLDSQLLADALRINCQLEILPPVCGLTELLQSAAETRVDVAVLGRWLEQEFLKGRDAVGELSRMCPDSRVIVLLRSATPKRIVGAFQAGARGLFSEDQPVDMLAKCILSVHKGQIWANNDQLSAVIEHLAEMWIPRLANAQGIELLSERETQVVQFVTDGCTNREIAQRLRLSEHTIKNYVFNIFEKLGLSSRVELVRFALRHRTPLSSERVKTTESDNRAPSTWDWVHDAAAQGFGLVQYLIAERYRVADKVNRDNVAAYVWFSLAERLCNKLIKDIRTAKEFLSSELTTSELQDARSQLSSGIEQPKWWRPQNTASGDNSRARSSAA